VKEFGQAVSLTGSNGVTQTLSGLSAGGAGDILTFSNKELVDLELAQSNATANLDATAAATGEQFFVVSMLTGNGNLTINATPSNAETDVVAHGGFIDLAGNSGAVSIEGDSATGVTLGKAVPSGAVTSGINANVSVSNVGTLAVDDHGNQTTQENVTITESTISGTGMFGNNSVTVTYNNIGAVNILTGQEIDTYNVVGSNPSVTPTHINIFDFSTVILKAEASLGPDSGLDLTLDNGAISNHAPASLVVNAIGAVIETADTNPITHLPLPTGGESVSFPQVANNVPSQVDWVNVDLVNITRAIRL
jgi:hypothetical protein